MLAICLLVACLQRPAPPRSEPLQESELAALELEGGISPHLPIRFSAMITNTLRNRELRAVFFEVDGRRFEVRRRIAPGESRRVSFQWVYPEDPAWDSAGTREVSWRLVGAEAVEFEPPRAAVSGDRSSRAHAAPQRTSLRRLAS